jgi:hypothetical protein
MLKKRLSPNVSKKYVRKPNVWGDLMVIHGGKRPNSGRKSKNQVKPSVTTRKSNLKTKKIKLEKPKESIELPSATLEQLDALRGSKSRLEYLMQQLNLDFLEQQRIKQVKTMPRVPVPVEDLGINPHLKRNLAALEAAYGGR